VVEGTQAIPFALDVDNGHFEYIGPQGPQRLGFGEELWKQPGFLDKLMPRDRNGAVRQPHRSRARLATSSSRPTVLTHDEKRVDLRWVVSCEITGRQKVLRGMMLDVTDQRRLENDWRRRKSWKASAARRGRGTRDQYSGAVRLGQRALRARGAGRPGRHRRQVSRAADCHRKWHERRRGAAKAAEEAEDEADLDYILENAPVALDRARDGLGRVAAIVRSMKEFAHPDRKEKAQADINQAIASTLVIASNEYKYVADVETDFAQLPLVNCFAARSTRLC
jgi:hypothetical protein